MTPTHTPGPWHLVSPRRKKKPNRYDHNQQVLVMGTADFFQIANVGGPSNLEMLETWQANARLIAAAPELLEACEYVARWHREHDSGEGELYGLDFVTTCIAAIRKAEFGSVSELPLDKTHR